MASPLRFIFSHAFFVSLCAAALAFETTLIGGIAPGFSLLLVFFSTLAAYNFYILVCRYAEMHKFIWRSDGSHAFMLLISGLMTACLLCKLPACLPYIAGASILTVLYALPRTGILPGDSLLNKGYLKTFILAATWTGVTVFVPLAGSGSQAMSVAATLLPLRGCFMLILCIIFDSRDVSVDSIKGLNSLATDVSPRQLNWIIHGVFLLYFLSTFLCLSPVFIVAYLLTGVVAYIIFRSSLKKRGYYFYYFLVDGLMLFSALMVYLATF